MASAPFNPSDRWSAGSSLGPAVLGSDDESDALYPQENEMSNLTQLSEQISELQGSLLAMECFLNSLAEALPADARPVVQAFYASESEAFRAALMRSTAPEATVNAFERDVQRALRLLGEPIVGAAPEG
ncbi:MAG: hypothetical protein ABI330_22295 [Caldimonas sp.]